MITIICVLTFGIGSGLSCYKDTANRGFATLIGFGTGFVGFLLSLAILGFPFFYPKEDAVVKEKHIVDISVIGDDNEWLISYEDDTEILQLTEHKVFIVDNEKNRKIVETTANNKTQWNIWGYCPGSYVRVDKIEIFVTKEDLKK